MTQHSLTAPDPATGFKRGFYCRSEGPQSFIHGDEGPLSFTCGGKGPLSCSHSGVDLGQREAQVSIG